MAVKVVAATANCGDSGPIDIRVGAHEFIMDLGRGLGGDDRGPAPVQYFLASICGCLSAAGRLVAAEMGLCLRSLSCSCTGEIDLDGFTGKNPATPSGLRSVAVHVVADMDADDDQLQRWLRVVRERCPVTHNLDHPGSLALIVDASRKDAAETR